MTNELIEAMERADLAARRLPMRHEIYEDLVRAALAAAEAAGYRLVPAEPIAWRRPAITGSHRWVFAYAREAAHFNGGAWEPLYAAAPDHSELVRPMVSQWVPVSERLPEKEQYPVLVAHQSGAVRLVFGISPFIDGDWMGYYEPSLQGRFLRGITHWMPLPAAPEAAK